MAEVKSRYARKYNCLLNKNSAENGIQSNPNNVVWNLSSRSLTNEEYDVLSYGLNHGLATNLATDTVVLKPDKCNGVVVIDMTDYYKSLIFK